ncbi:MAG: Card1-like endonuclease domain-containing protein [Lachnospiraceae bacterium]
MNHRDHLGKKDTILLCGKGDDRTFTRTFTILKKVGEGASTVCYEACYGKDGEGSRGILKEFYPQEAYALERNEEGQLLHSQEFQDSFERFRKAEKEYLQPCKMLMRAKQNNENLSAFIPNFEIYHGSDRNGNAVGTTYVWTPQPNLETFEKVCDEIHRHPSKQPERQLVIVLKAVETLTECICDLHRAELIHCDIKPSNFGFIKHGNEIRYQTLSMFDINSICSVYQKADYGMGTEGYMEPETGQQAANNQTDIYAIGAVLFHAIVLTEETKKNGYLFREEYYDQLSDMVKESELIQASEVNSHPRLRSILTRILKKCLCERSERYANCEELLEDLKEALFYVCPSSCSAKGKKWELKDIEDSLDQNKEKNSFQAIQYHLYEHPLYECLTKQDEIHVLVIGFGNYGQKFLDVALQVGQMPGKKLYVTVVSDDAQDKEIYLSERPELKDFFCVERSIPKEEDSYGSITFQTLNLKRENQSDNKDILQDYLCEQYEDKSPDYIFISLGEDDLNVSAAEACKEAAQVLEMNFSVNYICEAKKTDPHAEKPESGWYPLYVNADIKKSKIYPEIERMAFNTHLVWEKNLSVDYKNVQEAFRKPYNHNSCVSNVLSLKYKLYSIGIDLEEKELYQAAEQFQRNLKNKTKNELIWIEHRRWVTEKLCLGWKRMKDLEKCVDSGMTKDERHKEHVCIVKSRPEQRLNGWNREEWDGISGKQAAKNKFDDLDDLERMSVELHRMYMKKAGDSKSANWYTIMDNIRTEIEGDRKALVAFQEWFSCMKEISGESGEKIYAYKGLKACFLEKAQQAFSSEGKKKLIRSQVEAVDHAFYLTIASKEYRNWKQDDVALIENIPFVLTYTKQSFMVLPFSTGDNDAVFGNVASATVVNPGTILYLYLVEKVQDIKELLDSVSGVLEYMRKKRLRASIEFIVAYVEKTEKEVQKSQEKLLHMDQNRIKKVKLFKVDQVEETPKTMKKYLKSRQEKKNFFVVEKNATKLSYLLLGANVYQEFPSYKFDSRTMKFYDVSNCKQLVYIRKKPYISVADMASFRLSSSESSNQPEFFDDYKDLWNLYCANNWAWKNLCNILANEDKKHAVLVTFYSQKQQAAVHQEYHYIIPLYCEKNAKHIIDFLKQHAYIGGESCVDRYNSTSCRVTIVDLYQNKKNYDTLFSRVYALMVPDAIRIFDLPDNKIKVEFDNLVVEKFYDENLCKNNQLLKLMSWFKEKGYVTNFVQDPSTKEISFTYASREIKELMTTAGKILEVYTYHKVKESGQFDDVVSSYEINWKEKNIKNEFDCILTKGFCTLFVECKARKEVQQEFYFKISSLTKQFGINATAVLLVDTKDEDSLNNIQQIEKGDMMNVVTISSREEIADIGQVLLKVITGKYHKEED